MLKRLLMFMTLTASLLVMAPVQEAAADGGWWSKWREWRQERMQHRRSHSQRVKRVKSWSYRKTESPSRSVPELDPSAAGSAIVLLVGGVAYIASRRREEDIA